MVDLRKMTVRRRAVLAGVIDGKSNRDISAGLECSPETVKYHIRRLLVLYDVENRVRLAVVAARGPRKTG